MTREKRAVRALARKRGVLRNKKKLLAGGFAGGVAIAIGTPGYAAPAGTDLTGNPIVLSNTPSAVGIDVDGDDQLDLAFSHTGRCVLLPPESAMSHTEAVVEGLGDTRLLNAVGGYYEARFFEEDDPIGPPAGPVGALVEWGWLAYYDLQMPDPPTSQGHFGNERGFAGFKFSIGGQEHWGWIEVEVVYPPGSCYGPAMRLYGWGYETEPQTGIPAGALPEPGTLASLAVGAAAVTLGTRRRKAQG